jgi:hypothetical protein
MARPANTYRSARKAPKVKVRGRFPLFGVGGHSLESVLKYIDASKPAKSKWPSLRPATSDPPPSPSTTRPAFALVHTQFAQATCGTIRLKLLKIGALVKVSVRRIKVALASSCPSQHDFARAYQALCRAAAPRAA